MTLAAPRSEPRRALRALLGTHWLWLGTVLVLAACVYFVRLAELAFVTDEIYHGIAVRAIVRTGKPLLPDGSLYLKGGLFSYLAALPSVATGSFEFGARAVSAASALGIGVFAYALTALITQSRRAGVLAAFVWAFHPWTVEFARWGRLYGLAALLLIAAVYGLVSYDMRGGRRRLGLSLASLALGTTLYPFFVWCWLVFGGYGLVLWAERHPQHRRRVGIAGAVLAAAVPLAALLVWRFGDQAIAWAKDHGLSLTQVLGSTGRHAGPSVRQFLDFSSFYARFFFSDLWVLGASLVALSLWTAWRTDPVSGRRAPLALAAIALGGLAFVTCVHLQTTVPRYLFPIFPIAVVGAVCVWERVLRASGLAQRLTPYVALAAAWALYDTSAGALEPVTRRYGQEYRNPNFGPSPRLTKHSNFRGPVDVVESQRSPGDVVVSNRYQFYLFYADRQPEFSLLLNGSPEIARAPYTSQTRELNRCEHLDGVLRRRKSTVWLIAHTDDKLERCLPGLEKKHPVELVFSDPDDPEARVYRVRR